MRAKKNKKSLKQEANELGKGGDDAGKKDRTKKSGYWTLGVGSSFNYADYVMPYIIMQYPINQKFSHVYLSRRVLGVPDRM